MLSQLGDDGLEHPVVFAFRTLALAEKNYAQTDRKGLVIMFALNGSISFCLVEHSF